MKNSDIEVSISCTTYNHEKYIRKCLDGFLIQKTSFKYEIIIHDDASTDGTKQIIEEYIKKYPGVFNATFQTENQYSKGIKTIMSKFNFPKCKGKYIAVCEGDDYWIDENKLQEQYDLLESNQNVNLCFHAYQEYNETTKQYTSISMSPNTTLKHYSINEVILGDGSMMATCSLFFRREVVENLPDWFKLSPVGDYFIQMLGSLKGGALFLNKSYAIYRVGQSNSWSDRMKNTEQLLIWYDKIILALNSFVAYTDNNYVKEINLIKAKCSKIIIANGDIEYNFRRSIFLTYRNELDVPFKIKWMLLYSRKNIHKFYLKLRS